MLRRSRQGATEFTLLLTCWLILSAWDKSQTAATLALTRCSSASLTLGLGLCLAPCWRVCHQHHRSLRLGGGERLMRVPTCLRGSSLLCSFTSCPSSHPACLPACGCQALAADLEATASHPWCNQLPELSKVKSLWEILCSKYLLVVLPLWLNSDRYI